VAAEYNMIDLDAEVRVLDDHEQARFKDLARELDKPWALEENKARQRSWDRVILEGDRNASYFMALANHRARKKRIDNLQDPNGLVHETDKILEVAVDFYKNLFKKENRGNFYLSPNFWDAENCSIPEIPFSEEEVKATNFCCYPEGSLGPDGLSFLFY
jgi:hypothetical protein